MTIKEISNTEDLFRELNSLPNSYIYRGQASSDWPLTSSLERVLGTKWSAINADKFEGYMLKCFKSKLHLYDGENEEPTSLLAWLSLMQHYGAPTRLIDFTESAYIALYFAIETIRPGADEGKAISVFAINYTQLMEASLSLIKSRDNQFNETRETLAHRQDVVYDEIVNRFTYDVAWVTEPGRINKRLDRQAGCFLLSMNRNLRMEQILSSPTYSSVDIRKYIIPRSLIPGIWALLRKVNINSKVIYGDLAGLCSSLRMEAQIYSS